jgi:replicative DNA helicase Mcm
MSKEEMNEYLESIGGLENGFYPDSPRIVDSYFFDVNIGWFPLIKDLIEDLIKLGWDKQVCQVKEKFGCYDDKTEVLTKSGWKLFKDCTFNDEIAILNQDGYMSYHNPTDIISYEYSGNMYKLKSRGVDLLVTPNHNLYVAKGGWVGKYNKNNVTKYEFSFETPDKYFKKTKRFKKSFKWVGEEIDTITIGGYNYSSLHLNGKIRNYVKSSQEYNVTDFLKFIGFYTAEGCVNKDKGDIRIAACNDGSVKAKVEQLDFEEVLKLNNFKIKKSLVDKPALTYNIYDKVLANWLHDEIGESAINKKCPEFIKNLTPKLIEIYLTWLFYGDGHKSKTALTLYTSSKLLADDVCELILKCGYTFKMDKLPPKSSTKIKSDNPTYTVRWLKNSNEFEISNKTIKNTNNYTEEYIKYDGIVYCLTVPNNNLFVRRNGKGVWCGNSLRFYINYGSDEIFKRISEAENLSYKTCETCGQVGELRTDIGWYTTLCDEHYTEKKNNKNKQ